MNWTAFIDGAARVFDLFGTMSMPIDLPATDEEARRRDLQALASDWQAVAKDSTTLQAASRDIIGGATRPLDRHKTGGVL